MWKSIALSAINRALPILIGELWAFLKDAVATYEATTLTGAQKRDAVVLDAFMHCQKAGLDISAQFLNLGIESALAVVRARAG